MTDSRIFRGSRHAAAIIAATSMLSWTSVSAQVPVDADGNVIGAREPATGDVYSTAPATGNEGIPLLDATELEELVGPIALYPDDLLAVVLPASTYPLQVVQAARFLEDLESDPSLEPDPDWDDSIIALINYPEVVELLNEDLDWTWRLGEAVVAQQADVVTAVENFRDRAYAAGNLKSDDYQTVSRDEGIIEITPVNEEIIYVPYYEPAKVVYYQPRPVYFYYPRPCPVYYYPYPSYYSFRSGYFWGVTTAFTIGWATDHLHVYHHSYRGHPYYGYRYRDRWWYRRPSIHVHNNIYINQGSRVSINRYNRGDYWRPSRSTRLRASDQRITRSVHYSANSRSAPSYQNDRHTTRRSTSSRRTDNLNRDLQRRERDVTLERRSDTRSRTTPANRSSRSDSDLRRQLAARDRDTTPQRGAESRTRSTVRQREQRAPTSPRADFERNRSRDTSTQRRSTVREQERQATYRRSTVPSVPTTREPARASREVRGDRRQNVHQPARAGREYRTDSRSTVRQPVRRAAAQPERRVQTPERRSHSAPSERRPASSEQRSRSEKRAENGSRRESRSESGQRSRSTRRDTHRQ